MNKDGRSYGYVNFVKSMAICYVACLYEDNSTMEMNKIVDT